MPFSNPKQPIAALLNIKRRQGLAAAKAFGAKHSTEMSTAVKSVKGVKPYTARKKRGM